LRPVKLSPDVLKEIEQKVSQTGGEMEPGYEPPGSSEGQILLNVHEFFHGFQKKCGAMEGGGSADITDFKVNAGYATYSNIEGLALINAFEEKEQSKARECLKDSVVARQIKQSFMPDELAAAEKFTSLLEGTASYANIRMAQLIKEQKYKAGMSREDDPFFFDFKFMKGNIENHTTLTMPFAVPRTFGVLDNCYQYGAYQCFLLDRFFPGWKKDFFRDKKKLDDVMAGFLKLSGEEKAVIAKRLKTKYSYDKLFAKHDAAVKEKDKAIELVKNRQGKKYILDCKKTGELFMLMPEKRKIFYNGIERFYPHGIRKYTSGQIEITSVDTPIYSPAFRIMEWVDAGAKKGDKGFELSFTEKIKDIYKNVEFRTK